MTPTTTVTASPTTLTKAYCRGVTLPELVIVTALLAVVAAAAVPNLASSENQRLRLAVQAVSNAIGHARDESMRTGEVHSVELYPATQEVLVVKITDFGVMEINRPVIYHPVTKQPYRLDLDDNPATAGSRIQANAFNFSTQGTQTRIDFTPNGQPVFIDITDQANRLLSGSITLQLNDVQQTLLLDALTGRLTDA